MPTSDTEPFGVPPMDAEWQYDTTITEECKEPMPLSFRQKLALEWIIFKAWVKRVFRNV